MLKLGIGAWQGKMGQALLKGIEASSTLQVGALTALDAASASSLAPAEVTAAEGLTDTFEVFIDFSSPQATLAHLAVCEKLKKPIVIGTTGLTPDQEAAIATASQNIPVFYASNMSIGMNLCFNLAAQTARALGDDFDVEIIETHHRDKRDAPSGTALTLGRGIADALGRDLQSVASYGREGDIGPRDSKTIGFSTIRAGSAPGTHTVLFGGTGESITITHEAHNRDIFAQGALRAAQWLANQPAGQYNMADMLELS